MLRLVAVAHQLHIDLRRHSRRAGVDHVVLHADVIGAALERIGLDQLDAALLGRLKAHLHAVLAILELALAGHHGHRCLVIGVVATNQTRLTQVHTLGVFLEHLHQLLVIDGVRVLEQLRALECAAFAVEGQAHHIAGNRDSLARRCCRCRLGTRRCAGHVTGRSTGCSRQGQAGICRLGSIRRRRTGRLGCGEEGGLFAVMDLPLVPEQNHGKAKYHPQYGAANIVHEDFLGEEGWVVADSSEALSIKENSLGFC